MRRAAKPAWHLEFQPAQRAPASVSCCALPSSVGAASRAQTNASITEMAAATRRSRKASDPPPCTPAGDNDELRARIREASLKLKNALSCPVCHDWFEDPIALGCGHALCRKCALEWLANTPSCPKCRTAADPRGASRRDVARDLERAVAAAKPCVAMAGTPGPKKRGRDS